MFGVNRNKPCPNVNKILAYFYIIKMYYQFEFGILL